MYLIPSKAWHCDVRWAGYDEGTKTTKPAKTAPLTLDILTAMLTASFWGGVPKKGGVEWGPDEHLPFHTSGTDVGAWG